MVESCNYFSSLANDKQVLANRLEKYVKKQVKVTSHFYKLFLKETPDYSIEFMNLFWHNLKYTKLF